MHSNFGAFFMTCSFCEHISVVGNIKFYQMYIIGCNFVDSINQCSEIKECKFLYFLYHDYLLNSSSAFVDDGTDCAGHDRKWNCVTVLVSPVRVFFKYTDLTK